MNRILYYILLVIFSTLGASFMVFSSMNFADPDTMVVESTKENYWYKVVLSDSNSIVKYIPIAGTGQNVTPDTVLFGDIWRLSSFLYLFETGSTVPPLSLSGKNNIVLSNVQGIISFYDLFSKYTIASQENDFRLEQITNGSFYIGRSENGKLVIYSIDGVARLVFLDKGVEMTNMILFPGSYIRFDPSKNASLKSADLFRIITTLAKKDSWSEEDFDNDESFEFMDPRADTMDGSDIFFNSRLPFKTIKLFRVLSARFHNQVAWINLANSYDASVANQQTAEFSSWLMNPSKKNHLMFLELRWLLSKVVKSNGNTDELVARIAKLYEIAKSLDTETSSAGKIIEQFLLDGHFALYGDMDNVGASYQDTYEKIARMIGIEPTAWKSKLLQNLADIYSGNLFLQSSKVTSFRINTYNPTAEALYATLNETTIEQKDFFDIAIYVYNILDKVHDKWILSAEFLENESTYKYLTIFFRAGEKYMNSIDDQNKKIDTIVSFSSQFYAKILSIVVASLYDDLMYENEGALYLRDNLVRGSDISMDKTRIWFISNLESNVSRITEMVDTAYTQAHLKSNSDTYIRIQKATLRLKALKDILDPSNSKMNYKMYLSAPYISEKEFNDANLEVILPKVSADMQSIERIGIQKKIDTVPLSPAESSIGEKFPVINSIFPDADISAFVLEWWNLRTNKAKGYIRRIDDSIVEWYWTLLISRTNQISQVFLQYGGRNIEVKFPTNSIDVATFLDFQKSNLPKYLDIIEANSDIPGNARILLAFQRIDIGETSFSLE